MDGMLREAGNYAAAIHISFAIEKLDKGIQLSDDDLEQVSCLNDMIAVVGKIIALRPVRSGTLSAEDLVRASVREMLPSMDFPPGDMPLVDAFGPHWQEMARWLWGPTPRARTIS
jgi:hypothetical protein